MGLNQKQGNGLSKNIKSDDSILNNNDILNQKNRAISGNPSVLSAGYESVTNGQPYANIEEKVAQLSLQLNQVFVKPYLQQALNYLKQSKNDAINSYNNLSDQIATEVKIVTQNTNTVTSRLADAQNIINRTQQTIRNKYDNATEEEISTGAVDVEYEYNIIAEHYEVSLQLSQEISTYKSRVHSLSNLQSLLDQSMIPFTSRLQLEIDNLEILVHNFDSSDYADIIAKKHGINSGAKLRSNDVFKGRSEDLNNYASGVMSLNTDIQAPKVEKMVRHEDLNRQSINTFASKSTQQIAAQPVQQVVAQPVQQPIAQPVQQPIAQPVQQTVVNQQPNVKPEVQTKHHFWSSQPKPKESAPQVAPVQQQPIQQQTVQHIYEQPVQQPVQQQTVQHIYEQPVQQPVQQTVQHVYHQQPAPQPVQQTVQHVYHQQPVQQQSQFSDQFMKNNPYYTDERISKQEQKIIRKLREQQMQFEHTMKMNRMIFEYNKSIDEMMRNQREYEKQFYNEVAANDAKNATVEEPKKTPVVEKEKEKAKIEKVADVVTNEEARLIQKKSGSKSIRVVK